MRVSSCWGSLLHRSPKSSAHTSFEYGLNTGDDWDRMIKGDPGMESIYQWDATVKAESYRGASGRGDGVHILTGPIFVEDAEPGDLLKVEILDLVPRPNPAGKTFGYEQRMKKDANHLFY